MASEQQVKEYIAYWFQLGKKVILPMGKPVETLQVLQGERYSQEFENCWQEIISKKNKQAYLEGTSATIEELLSQRWEITPCARCSLPVAMIDVGFLKDDCPCTDLDNWPNSELPSPRIPLDTQKQLQDIRERLLSSKKRSRVGEKPPYQNQQDPNPLKDSGAGFSECKESRPNEVRLMHDCEAPRN